MTFVFIAGLGALAAAGVARFLPAAPQRPPLTIRQWAKVFTRSAVRANLAITTIFMLGQFTVFTFIASTIGRLVGHDDVSVPVGLVLFGAAGFAGNSLAGKLADTRGAGFTARLAAITMGSSLVAVTALVIADPTPLVAAIVGAGLLITWGLGGWGLNAPQQLRLLAAAPEAGPSVLSANASALYAGQALGGLVGSITLRTVGVTWLGVVGGAFAFAAAVIVSRTKGD